MKIPTEKQFQKYIELASGKFAPDLVPDFVQLRLLDVSDQKKKLRNTLEQLKIRKSKLREELVETQVWKYLVSQPGFKAYGELLSKKKTKTILSSGASYDWLEHELNAYFNYQHVSDDSKQRRIERQLHASAESTVSFKLISALHEYLYTDNANAFHKKITSLNRVIKDFESQLKKMNEIGKFVEDASWLTGIRYDSFRSTRALFHLTERPANREWSEVLNKLPLRRQSAQNAERLFICRIANANRFATRFPKPEAIAELMTMSVFSHQFDLRTIHRICASIKRDKKAIE